MLPDAVFGPPPLYYIKKTHPNPYCDTCVQILYMKAEVAQFWVSLQHTSSTIKRGNKSASHLESQFCCPLRLLTMCCKCNLHQVASWTSCSAMHHQIHIDIYAVTIQAQNKHTELLIRPHIQSPLTNPQNTKQILKGRLENRKEVVILCNPIFFNAYLTDSPVKCNRIAQI